MGQWVAELMDSLSLFGDDPPSAPTAPAVEGVKWTRFRPARPVKCGVCVELLAAAGGDGPVAKSARFRRRAAARDDLLCYEHAQEQRHTDGLPEFRALRA
ncbi:hypothetical protein ACWENQ_44820 [Nonomuraea sp. NPDC004354]